MGDILRQSSVVAAVAVTIAINALANALPLNGQTTGAISDRFPVYFVPAGYVFSIWGLIYIGMIGFAIYQALPSQREDPLLRRIGYPFVASCVANVAWLFLWHYEQFVLTLVAMVALLVTLKIIYGRVQAAADEFGSLHRWMVAVPFSIYLGWITVATIANVSTVLYYLGWDGWGIASQAWAVIMLAAGGAIAARVSLPRADAAYVLVILWAFAGIAVKQSAAPLVALTAVAVAVILGTLMVSRVSTRGGGRRLGSNTGLVR